MLDTANSRDLVANDILPQRACTSAELPAMPSWLNIIAEMQGVPQVSLVRAQFRGLDTLNTSLVQSALLIEFEIRNQAGTLLGSAMWEGESAQLHAGATIDIGYSLCQQEHRHTAANELIISARVCNTNIATRLSLEALKTDTLMIISETTPLQQCGNDPRIKSALAAANQSS